MTTAMLVRNGSPTDVISLMGRPTKKDDSHLAVQMGDRIQKMRIALGATQAEIAEKMDLSDAAISMWEKGKTQPSLQKFADLARILKTTPEYLAFGVMYTGRRG